MVYLIEPELSYQILGILFKVHNKLGPVYQEKYYQRAVEKELLKAKIPFKRESPVTVGYDNESLGKYFIDFLIDNKIVLEIKTINRLHPKYFNQVLAYMKTLQVRLGIIANFKKDRLEYKRLILPKRYFNHPSAFA